MHGNNDEKQFLLSSLSLCDDLDGDDQERNCVIEDELIIPSRLYQYCLCSRIVGHCDGIICLSGEGDTTVLCNPSIKEFNLVPKSCLLPDEDCPKTDMMRFGYDSKAKEKEMHRVWKDTLPFSGLPLEFVIVAFDMSNEVFYLISQPEEDTFAFRRSLIVWKESLRLITYTYVGDAPKWFDI
ncbi:hypothetical protein ACLB2K_019372 [Fragaria x ananassa]